LDQDPAWNEIRAALRGAVGERTFGLWLEPLHYEGRSGDTLRLSGPPEVSAWASERLGSVLQSCAQAVLGPAVSVVISGAGAPPASAPPDPVASPRTSAERALNPKYTFEQFVIGNSNRFAHAAALSVAETPAQAYNPLFIYGPPGLGKTHLLHAIGNYVQRFGGGLRVRYTTVEAFTNEFVSALGSGSIGAFKAAFRDSDVLLIDDVEFLERTARTEEEFFRQAPGLRHAPDDPAQARCPRRPHGDRPRGARGPGGWRDRQRPRARGRCDPRCRLRLPDQRGGHAPDRRRGAPAHRTARGARGAANDRGGPRGGVRLLRHHAR
jgi:chromosomal replication initiator protein